MAVGPQLARVLQQYGLTSLTQWASDALVKGWTEDQLMLEMYNRPEFRTRFAGMFQREAKGLPPMSVDEYLSYEKTVTATASMWGMTLSKDEIDNMIGNDVSAQEADTRMQIAATAAYDSDPETRAELERLWGITGGQVMKYWMDPKKELGNLQQQYRIGEIAGQALRSNYGQITEAQARRLTEAGLTRDTALSGFEQFARQAQLFSPLDFGEQAIGQDVQIEALAGDASAGQAIEQRAERRKAEFSGGGEFVAGKEGFATGSARS